MKKFHWLVLALVLAGCAAQPVYEPVEDVYAPVSVAQAQIRLDYPQEAAAYTLAGENGSFYECDGYTLTVQTLRGGDLNATVETLTGYTAENLTLLEVGPGRYECAWTGAGEGGDQVSRMVLLDDGAYHYAVTVMAPAQSAGALQEIWTALLSSVSLGDIGP